MSPPLRLAPVLMPVLNNAEQTYAAIQDVLAQTLTSTLLVVDQGSDEVTTVMLRQQQIVHGPHRLQIWRHDPPLPALAATWNTGLRWAFSEPTSRSCLVVNNDVRLGPETYQALLEVQYLTDAWFVSACNVGAVAWANLTDPPDPSAFDVTASLCASRGGPDFSCFLITRDGFVAFQFDEGFQPAYYEDNDYHRRLELAGYGEKIFSVPVPYLHLGSGTLKDPANAALSAGWDEQFARSQAHYRAKWGGLPGHELYGSPFNG